MENPKHKLIYEFEGTRNLFTDPLLISELSSDKANLFIEIECTPSASTNSSVKMRFNGDSGSNYRAYSMDGNGSTPRASVSDSTTGIGVIEVRGIDRYVSRIYISGDSSGERYVESFSGNRNTINTYVKKGSCYLKNVLDDIEDLTLYMNVSVDVEISVKIYEIPKTQNLDNYDLIEEVVFENRSTDIVFDGLDGDSDEEYLLECDWDRVSGILLLNGDATANYTEERMLNNVGALSAANNTVSFGTYLLENGHCVISAKSGKERLVTTSFAQMTSAQQRDTAVWWDNILDPVTSLVIGNLSNSTGKFSLYKRKSNKTIDPVPMVTVAEIDVDNEDISAGYTISGINGDSIDGAIKIDLEGFVSTPTNSANNAIQGTINGSTSFSYQFIRSTSPSTVGAGSGNISSFLTNATVGNKTCNHTCYIYPKSGQNRPMLVNNNFYRNDASQYDIRYAYVTFNDEINEVNSIELKTGNTNTVTGKIRISVPKISANTCGTFTVTKN